MSELTAKQSQFVAEYLVDLNATQAAIRAGYAKSTADKKAPLWVGKSRESCPANMRHVWDAVTDAMAERSERTQITADFVLQGIVKNIKRCEQAEPVVDRNGDPVYVTTEQGDVVPAYKYDATNALKGYELVGKHLKMFTDKVDHSSEDGSMSPKHVPDEELDAEIARLTKQVGHGQ